MPSSRSPLPHTECTSAGACPLDEADTIDTGRRTAIGNTLLTAVAAVLAAPALTACAPKAAHTTAEPQSAAPLGTWTLRVRVSDFPTLSATGGIARIDGMSDKPVAVTRTEKGYAAFSLRCTHAGALVNPVDGGFLCSGHGAKFTPEGIWNGGHAAKNLKTLGTHFDAASGILTVTG